MTQAERFLADVEAFISRNKISPSVFGMAAMNDPSFVNTLRSGRQPTLRVVDKVYAYMGKKPKKVISR
jgi:hypothetical protein